MRKYKAWFHFLFAVLAAALSVLSLALLGYWFAQAYKGNAEFLSQRSGVLIIGYGVIAFLQVAFYTAALLIALSLPRIHRFSRTMFKWWLISAGLSLLAVLAAFPQTGFWETLPFFYPVLSVITAAFAILSLTHAARKHSRKR